jgi:uncharacterized membrane protein YtjA (UPF0391 family)
MRLTSQWKNWVMAFLVIALVAGVFSFGGIAVGITKIVFYAFLVLFLIAFLFGSLVEKRTETDAS